MRIPQISFQTKWYNALFGTLLPVPKPMGLPDGTESR